MNETARSGIRERLGLRPIINVSGTMTALGAMGIDPSATEPMYLENSGHPVSSRLAVARASKSHVNALGLTWDDATGTNNAHYAPFNWRSA